MSEESLSFLVIHPNSRLIHIIFRLVKCQVAEAVQENWNTQKPGVVEEFRANASVPEYVFANMISYKAQDAKHLACLSPIFDNSNKLFLW